VDTSSIAVVDDNKVLCEALDSLLRAYGYRVQVFGSAEEFLARGSIETYGCVIMDVKLPGISGLELHGLMEANDPHPPVIFLTAHDELAIALIACVARGAAVAYLAKPFEEASLLAAIRKAGL
jgi:FixJ family two-component response regulator